MRVRFFDYPLQFREHEEEYVRTFREVCGRGAYILGEEVARFEEEFASFVGAEHAVGVGNCTDALLLALRAADVGPGDEVISVSHTFVATIEVIRFLGASPVFADVAHDHNMDVEAVEDLVTPRTRAIIPVHLNGRVCSRMDDLAEIARARGVAIIEDAAQALGAGFKGKQAGTFGLAGCFSFYPAKLLGTFGDAGAVVTDDGETAARLRMMRNHGRGERGEVLFWGLNSRMDNIHAAFLGLRLKRLPEAIERRRRIASRYQEGLSEARGLTLPPPPEEGGDHYDVFQNYEVEAEDRAGLLERLAGAGVEAALPWGGAAVHQFEGLGLRANLPRTESLMERAVLLPLHPGLRDDQVEHVIESVTGFYR